MDADTTFSGMALWLQSIDPGHSILEVLRPALNVFKSETFAPDLSLTMILSAIIFAIYFRYFRIGPAYNALYVRIKFLKKCTANRVFTDNFYEFDLLMKEERFLEHGWNEFVETCLVNDPNVNANVEITVRPSDFINIDDCENSGLSIKWFHGLSAIYVGFGLLFTFVGLVAALYFSSAAINAVINTAAAAGGGHDVDVQRALAQLLNTATFKFLTSIAGLGCSIILAFLDRRWRSKIERGFDELCRELERCTVMVTPESIADRQYRMLGEIAEAMKRLAPSRSGAIAPTVAATAEVSAPDTTIKDAIDRIEAVVVATSQSLANSFEQSLTRHAPTADARPPEPAASTDTGWHEAATRIETTLTSAAVDLRTMMNDSRSFKTEVGERLGDLTAAIRSELPGRTAPIALPSAPATDSGTHFAEARWQETAGRIETTLAAAASDLRSISTETRAFKTSLDARLGDLAATIRADGERTTAAIQGGLSELATRQRATPATGADGNPLVDARYLEAADRIETTLAAAAGDLRSISAETRAFKTSLDTRLGDLAAAIRTDGERTTAAIQGGLSELATRKIETASAPPPGIHSTLETSQQSMAQLGATIDRLTNTLDQVEDKLAAHVTAFDALSRATREAERGIIASVNALQNASTPLTRVGTDISGAVAAMATGVDTTVRALIDSQQAGQRLAEDLRATCGQLQQTWSQHEGRFIAVDESVARILTAIIQHTEAHGETVRNHFVAIDSHLAHAVTALATNIEALQEVTSDLTEAVNGTDRLATLISEKIADQQG